MLPVWRVLLVWIQRLVQACPRLMLPQPALSVQLQVQLKRRQGKLGQERAARQVALGQQAALALLACCLGWQQALESLQGHRLGWLTDPLRLRARKLQVASWAELLRVPLQQPWVRQLALKLQEQLQVELWEAQPAVQPAAHQQHSEQTL